MVMKKFNDSGFTGLEAAIVLIAFVVVAAVFSYTILGAGFFTTQKAQETVYKGVEQSTSNIQLVGNIYLIQNGTAPGTDKIQLTIGLAPGAPTLDLATMKIKFSTTTTPPYDVDFSPRDPISPGQQVDITFGVTPQIQGGDKLTIELRPSTGAALPFTKTAPAVLTSTTILY